MSNNAEINQALFNQILDIKGELKQIWEIMRNNQEYILVNQQAIKQLQGK